MRQSTSSQTTRVGFATLATAAGLLGGFLAVIAALCLVAYLQGSDGYDYAMAGRNAALLSVPLFAVTRWAIKRAARA